MGLSEHEQRLFDGIEAELTSDPKFTKQIQRAERDGQTPDRVRRFRHLGYVGVGLVAVVGGVLAVGSIAHNKSSDAEAPRPTPAEAILQNPDALRATGTCAIELAATKEWVKLNPTDATRLSLPSITSYETAIHSLSVSKTPSAPCVPEADNPSGEYVLGVDQGTYVLRGTTAVPEFLEKATLCEDAQVRADAEQLFSQMQGAGLRGDIGALLSMDCPLPR